MHGYMGKILHVDLTEGTTWEEPIPEEIYKQYLTGGGLGTYILYRDIPKDADPLGPDNVLGFTSGLLTGTASFLTGRWMVMSKSPLTGGIGDANCGGNLAPAIKQCGYDAIFFRGISEKPVYLYVDNKGAKIRSATHVWGKTGTRTQEILEEECTVRKAPRIASIGMAGEKISYMAGVVNDAGRIAARSGLGAVMGSKKLKALVLNGSKQVKYDDPKGMKDYSKEFATTVRKSNLPTFVGDRSMRLAGHFMGRASNVAAHDNSGQVISFSKKFGTAGANELVIKMGDGPVKNWKGGPKDFPTRMSKKLSPMRVLAQEVRKYHCAQCAFGCGGIVTIKDNKWAKEKGYTHTHKPEYETYSAFGPLLLNDNHDLIVYINELLNQEGMDTISAGGTVAFAIECYENGLLTKEDTGGLELSWGNADAIAKLIEQMITRETPIGDMLADGSKIAAKRLGKGSEAYAITAGGQEPGQHDPRFEAGHILNFSASPTPGKHTNGMEIYTTSFLWEHVSWAPEVKPHKKVEDYVPNPDFALETVAGAAYKMLVDATGGCLMGGMLGVNAWNLFLMMEKATGWGFTPDDYMEIGKRIHVLRQMFNVDHGIEPRSMVMHRRLETPRPSGPNEGFGFATMPIVSQHWNQFGFDPDTGIPKKETLTALGLDQCLEKAVK